MSQGEISTETCLIGNGAILGSLGLVTLIVSIEQMLSENYDISVEIADERAMSQKRSPFRTVYSLVEYVSTLTDKEILN